VSWLDDARRAAGLAPLTGFDPAPLVHAFPSALARDAAVALRAARKRLTAEQRSDPVTVVMDGETLLVPHRLYFGSPVPAIEGAANATLMTRCLETRSHDGFQRQRALHALLADVRPWSAPFIALLIGDYVVEILADIDAAASPAMASALADFAAANPALWWLIRQRVASYWNVYYRGIARADYPGFRLVDRIQQALPR